MNKRIVSNMVLCSIIAIALLLSGCSSEQQTIGTNSTPGSTNTANQSAADGGEHAEQIEPAEVVELTISAAASLTDALNDIKQNYEAKMPMIELNFNFGASGALQQQIEQGAPADLFISAATKNMNALVDKQLIDANQQQTLLKNDLVVVVPADVEAPISSLDELTSSSITRVAIGIPESVPAGSYAKEALEHAKLWEALQEKTVQGKDVRQVLQYVETGNADAGFVYKTDALTSNNIKIVYAVDPDSYAPVEYPIGIVKATKHHKEAEQFYEYLQTSEALDVFVKYGFSIPK